MHNVYVVAGLKCMTTGSVATRITLSRNTVSNDRSSALNYNLYYITKIGYIKYYKE